MTLIKGKGAPFALSRSLSHDPSLPRTLSKPCAAVLPEFSWVIPLWSPLWVTRWLLQPDVTDGAGAQVCRCPRQVFPEAANDPGLIRSDYECISGHPHSHPLREQERDGGVLSSLPPGRQNPTSSTLRLSWERLLRAGAPRC